MLYAKKILIVDDAESTRHFMRHILASEGYRVYAASNAKQAMEHAREYAFDAVFTDIHMPGEDGISLIRKLRSIEGYQKIPILAVTMANTDAIKQKGKKAGATGWITKPVSPPNLLDLLRKLLLTDSRAAAGFV